MLFDTRYFWAVFTSTDPGATAKLRKLLERSKTPYASSISVYEVFRLSLTSEGRDVAELRAEAVEKGFEIIDVDSGIAREGAEISARLRVPMADALIMASAKKFQLACVTDDPHFSEVRRVWV